MSPLPEPGGARPPWLPLVFAALGFAAAAGLWSHFGEDPATGPGNAPIPPVNNAVPVPPANSSPPPAANLPPPDKPIDDATRADVAAQVRERHLIFLDARDTLQRATSELEIRPFRTSAERLDALHDVALAQVRACLVHLGFLVQQGARIGVEAQGDLARAAATRPDPAAQSEASLRAWRDHAMACSGAVDTVHDAIQRRLVR